MCGIAGLLGPEDPDRSRLVQGMLDALLHRGPDGRDLFTDGPLVLGHLRLAIYDPSPAAAQPMIHPESGNVLAFNGAIYNHQALRSDLRSSTRSTGDTECLLRLLEEHGLDALSRLNGIWAFAHWDVKARRLTLSRDRFGVKPLFWTRWRDQFAFASEIRALLTLPGLERRADPTALADFLTERSQGGGTGTFLAGIHRLPAATTMRVEEDGKIGTVIEHWKPPAVPPAPDRTLTDLLSNAVELRLQADAPIALTLSGGLDSTSIAALAARAGHTVTAYTLRYGNQDPEFSLATSVTERYPAIEQRVVEPDRDDFPTAFEDVTRTLGEPFADGSMIAHHALMRAISGDGFKVVLSGLGGDEALAGYVPTYLLAHAADLLRAGRWTQASSATVTTRLMARAVAHALPARWKNRLRRHRNHRTWRPYLSADLLAAARPRFSDPGVGTLFHDYLNAGRNDWFLPGFLHYDDHNAMAFGLEARAPFLDRRVVEWGLAVAPDRLVGGGLGKLALRALARDLLPSEVADNPIKRGLPAPARTWILDHPNFVQDMLAEGGSCLPEIDFVAVGALYRAGLDRGELVESEQAIIWRCLSAAVWARQIGARA